MGQILVIDDDPHIREILEENIADLGHTPLSAEGLSRGLSLLKSHPVDLVFLDIRLPDANGLEQLPNIRRSPSEPEVIIVTGVGDAAGAKLAIQTGAWDYLQKPLARKKIHLQIERVFDYRKKTGGNERVVSLKRDDIIGNSHAVKQTLDQVAQCARSKTNVLITGETGTGKELFARAIHDNSDRAGRVFIVVDCAALSETLAESILFGHEKGAFTGADRNRPGLLAEADGGSLFLDEVGELPLSIQKTFLRLIQERRFRRVGAVKEKKLDFRLISATHRNLETMSAKGDFRLDLLFRLRTFEIRLPPLRFRIEDIQPLTLHYLYHICRTHGLKVKGMLPEFLDHLQSWHWPGNVRELINTLEAAALTDPDNPTLFPKHLPASIRSHHLRCRMGENDNGSNTQVREDPPIGIGPGVVSEEGLSPPEDLPLFKTWRNTVIETGEKAYLQRLISITEGDIPTACDIAQLSQSRLYHLLKKYGISKSASDNESSIRESRMNIIFLVYFLLISDRGLANHPNGNSWLGPGKTPPMNT